jgi:hypothetical protein
MNFTEQNRGRLSAEIFEATGLAVDKDDPVVICALMQSHYMQQAQKQVSENLAKSAEDGVKAIDAAIKATADLVAVEVSKRITSAIQQSAESESARLKAQLGKYAEGLKRSIRSLSVTSEDEPQPSRKLYGAVATALAMFGFVGVIIGSTAFAPPSKITAKQMELMTTGALFMEIFPTLDKQTREKLKRSLQERAKSSRSK